MVSGLIFAVRTHHITAEWGVRICRLQVGCVCVFATHLLPATQGSTSPVLHTCHFLPPIKNAGTEALAASSKSSFKAYKCHGYALFQSKFKSFVFSLIFVKNLAGCMLINR